MQRGDPLATSRLWLLQLALSRRQCELSTPLKNHCRQVRGGMPGRVSLWRYNLNERNYPGWNLDVDAAGCGSLLELIDAFTAAGAGGCAIKLDPSAPERRE